MNKIIVAGLVLLSLIMLNGCKGNSSDFDGFAQCLAENNVTMYGTEWCSHCQNQKAEFGASFKYVNFMDCDKQREECISAGVEGYPTWVINGNNYPGEQKLLTLASLSGCSLYN